MEEAKISFDVAMIVWSSVSILLMIITGVAVFFARSWKHRVDKDYVNLSDKVVVESISKEKEINKIREDHAICKFHVVETYVDKDTFHRQVGQCVTIQNKVFDKVEELAKEISETNKRIYAFKVEIIKEIRNGNGSKK